MVKGLVTVFPTSIRPRMRKINWDGLEEIRVRIGWPVELIYGNHNEWLGNYDSMIDRQCLDEMLNYITGYSIYAMDEEIKQGYITFSGGHRIGITGHATYEALRDTREHRITNIIDIGGLNIRIAHERKGCAEKIVPHLRKENSIYNTLFFAAPGVGKTTYLRDTIRILSETYKISVIDERSEIAACVNGKAQNDLGKRTDVLDACPKEIGMKMVLRTMSPDIIAVDEIGKEEEFVLLEQMRCSGVKILGTIHAGDIEELLRNPMIRDGVRTGAIERFVELIRLDNGQRKYRVFDGQGNLLWGK
ncbi:MAG: Flp pilus assembly complex ATPase component TadA [Agathobacter sp.]|nr:Flp pilus assembly complex ATPase component TadA [Agathobacter sp.]